MEQQLQEIQDDNIVQVHIDELKNFRGSMGLGIERDSMFPENKISFKELSISNLLVISLDIKSSNTYHKSFELQVAAYAKAYTEITGIEIHRTGVLWMKSAKRGPSKKQGEYQGKGWELKAIDDIDKNHELFMLIYKLYELEHEEVEPVYKSYPTTVKLEITDSE
jgi:hypothetical protein